MTSSGLGKRPQSHEELGHQAAELAAMRRMLSVSQGTFSLSFAVCNSPALRDYLIGRLRELPPEPTVVSIPRGTTDPFGLVQSQVDAQHAIALFITDIERTIDSDDKRQATLRSLNASRELWERFQCPVVFWVPEYAATLLSTVARDFWRYRSHRFEFVSDLATAQAGVSDHTSGDLSAASNLPRDEKQFRIAELEQRIEDAGQAPKPELRVHVLQWLNEFGSLHIDLGQLEAAEAAYQHVLELGGDDPLWQAVAYGNLGIVMDTRGDLDGAEAMYRKALEIDEKLGRLEGMANQYGNLGNVMKTRGDLDGAEAMYRKALEINEKLGRLEGMASNYGNLGIVMQIRGDLDGAEAMYRKSLQIDEKLGRLEGMANQYGNRGIVMEIRGDLDGAEAMYRKSLEISEKLGRLEGMASQYGNLGNVMKTRGDLDGAEAMYRKSLEIEEKLGRLEGMASDYGNLGNVMKTRGDLDGARQFWTESRDLFDQLGAQQRVEKVQGWIDDLPE